MSALLGAIHSLQRLPDLGRDFFREVGGAGIGEMHVRRELDLGEAGLGVEHQVSFDRNQLPSVSDFQ